MWEVKDCVNDLTYSFCVRPVVIVMTHLDETSIVVINAGKIKIELKIEIPFHLKMENQNVLILPY